MQVLEVCNSGLSCDLDLGNDVVRGVGHGSAVEELLHVIVVVEVGKVACEEVWQGSRGFRYGRGM